MALFFRTAGRAHTVIFTAAELPLHGVLAREALVVSQLCSYSFAC
jgi:hypothetical protein